MTAYPIFREMVSGNAPSWALEVATPRDLTPDKFVDDGPAVAFAMLNFSPAAQAYIDSFDYDRDFKKPNTHWLTSIMNHFAEGPLRDFSEVSHYFSIAGWRANPARSDYAHKKFKQKAEKFYPDRPGRNDMLDELADAFAQIASVLNRSSLRFAVRAGDKMDELTFHRDIGEVYSAGAYVTGKATLHAAPGTHDPVAYSVPRNSFTLSAHALEEAQYLPRQCIALWPLKQPHSSAVGENLMRSAVFAFAKQDEAEPARPAEPTWRMRLRDSLTNRFLS